MTNLRFNELLQAIEDIDVDSKLAQLSLEKVRYAIDNSQALSPMQKWHLNLLWTRLNSEFISKYTPGALQ